MALLLGSSVYFADLQEQPVEQLNFSHLISSGIACLFFILMLIIVQVLKKKIEDKHSRLGILLRHLSLPIKISLLLTLLYAGFETLKQHWILNPLFDHLYSIVAIAGICWLAIKSLNLFAAQILQYYDVQQKDNYRARKMHTRIRVLKRLLNAVIIFITFIFMLMTFEQIRAQGISILASAGVVSIIVGLAAQKTIGTFFSGIQIAIAQPMRVEDVVVVEKEWGTIEEIHLTYVVVKLWDFRRLIVPITYFTDHPFQNWTQKTADLLGVVMLYVDYGMPIQPIREELTRILEGNPLWDGKVKVVQVTDVSEKGLELRILASAPNSGTAFDLRCAIRERLISFLQKSYPSHFIRVRAEFSTESPLKNIYAAEPPKDPVRAPAPTLESTPKPMAPEKKS